MTPEQIRNLRIKAVTAIGAKRGLPARTNRQKLELAGWISVLVAFVFVSMWLGSYAGLVIVILGFARLIRNNAGIFGGSSTYRRTLSEGELCRAVIIQANSILFRPGKDAGAPALVMISPGKHAIDLPYLNDLVFRLVHESQRTAKLPVNQVPAELRKLDHVITRNQLAIKYRRIPIPASWTDGEPAYAADIIIRRDFLRDGYLSGQPLWCMASPGPKGGLELVPHDAIPIDPAG